MTSSNLSRFSVCLFCYKTNSASLPINAFRKTGLDTHGNEAVVTLVKRFLTHLERFSNEPSGREDIICNIKSPNWLGCCKECEIIIGEFCDLYHQMKLLELQLDWRLYRLASSMELAGRIPTRWTKVAKLFQTQTASHLTEEQRSCGNSISSLRRLRQNVIKKCSSRLSKSLPRVLIKEKAEKCPVSTRYDDMPKLRGEDDGTADWAPAELKYAAEVATPTDPFSLAASPTSSKSDTLVKRSQRVARQVVIVKVEKQVEEENEQIPTPNLNHFEKANKCQRSIPMKPEPKEDSVDSYDHEDPFTSDPDYDAILHQSDNESSDSDGAEEKTEVKIPVSTGHKCSVCRKVFRTRSLLDSHSTVHKPGSYPFKCTLCEKSFRTRSFLVDHQGRAHGQGTQIPCQICERVFFTQLNLQRHIRVVHADPSHKCPQCGKGFKTNGKLKEHTVNVHNEEHIYKCLECGNVLKSRRAMRQHALIHKPSAYRFTCSLCGYKCIQKHTLRVHMRIHQNISQTQIRTKTENETFM